MRLSIGEQRNLDVLVKELKLKVEMIKEDAYLISPDIRNILIIMGDVLLMLEQKIN